MLLSVRMYFYVVVTERGERAGLVELNCRPIPLCVMEWFCRDGSVENVASDGSGQRIWNRGRLRLGMSVGVFIRM